jgi:hypothetical protein
MFDVTRWLGASDASRFLLALIPRPDYAHGTTEPTAGETLSTGRLFRAYFRAFVRLTHTVRMLQRAKDRHWHATTPQDRNAGTTFSRALQQIEPSAVFMKPKFIAKILWNACFAWDLRFIATVRYLHGLPAFVT